MSFLSFFKFPLLKIKIWTKKLIGNLKSPQIKSDEKLQNEFEFMSVLYKKNMKPLGSH